MNKMNLLLVGILVVVLVFAGCNCETKPTDESVDVEYEIELKNNENILPGNLGDYVDIEFDDLKNETIAIKFPEGTSPPSTITPQDIFDK